MFKKSILLIISSLFFSSLAAAGTDRPKQYVNLAFDGSKNVKMWKRTRAFAKENNLKFSYFISGVYFIPNSKKSTYIEPQRGAGKSAIGFGGTSAAIKERLEQISLAVDEGHEIASHSNGHYDGSSYSKNQWSSDFEQFQDFMYSAWSRMGNEENQPEWWNEYFTEALIGFRAPQLGKSSGLWPALVNNGYVYDTSRVEKMGYWPKVTNGLWDYPLASVKIWGTGKKTLSMDYNFYYAQSGAVRGNPEDFAKFEEQMYQTYMAYFKHNYYGNRAPIDIGHHFSLWNGGIYWKALKRFAVSVCSKPEVVCGTYTELTDFLKSKSEEELANIYNGNFTKMPLPTNDQQASLESLGALTATWGEVSDQELQELKLQGGDHIKAHED